MFESLKRYLKQLVCHHLKFRSQRAENETHYWHECSGCGMRLTDKYPKE